jgi:hypothetical protein
MTGRLEPGQRGPPARRSATGVRPLGGTEATVEQNDGDKSRRLQVAGIWLSAANLAVAVYRAALDVWQMLGR